MGADYRQQQEVEQQEYETANREYDTLKSAGLEVYKAISRVQAGLSSQGIAKNNKNKMQGYQFRGIDDIYNALSTIMSKNALVILPRVLEREVVERTTKNGGSVFYTTVKIEYSFVSTLDGSKHLVEVYGEAMDSGDKSTNKAMSAAYKYACLQAFCIPTEGDNDADGSTHEVMPKAVQCIAADKVEALNQLIRDTDTNVANFLKWLGVGAVSQIPNSRYKQAYEALLAKMSKMETMDPKEIPKGGEPANGTA